MGMAPFLLNASRTPPSLTTFCCPFPSTYLARLTFFSSTKSSPHLLTLKLKASNSGIQALSNQTNYYQEDGHEEWSGTHPPHGNPVHNSEMGCEEMHHHHHNKQSHGHHSSDHHHSHGHAMSQDLNALQRAILGAASALGFSKLADFLRDNLYACCTSMALLLLAIICPYALPLKVRSPVQTWLLLIAFPLIGVPAILDAMVDVVGLRVNIHVLMALAAFASVIMGNALEGALLLGMFNLSHIAEDYFVERAMGDVKALKDSNPEFALVLEKYDVSSPPPLSTIRYTQVPVQKVEMGSHILIRAGEAVPVDGEVLQGRSMVIVEHLTGEVEPIEKQTGDAVPGGARNLDGMMILKATNTWEDSTLARIMKLTKEAQLNKPKLQRWLDKFGQIYSQAVVTTSVVVALFGPLLFKWPLLSNSGARGSVYRALGLMIALSPCALAVAPLAYATAISSCASKGILLKGGQALDSLAACDTIAFDKTGTLTTGDLICKAIEPIHGHGSDASNRSEFRPCCSPSCEVEALAVAAALERGATHPIARAVVDHSEGRKLPDVAVENFESLPGIGLVATVYGLESDKAERHKAHLGSLEYVASLSDCSANYAKIRDAAMASSHGNELVRAALSVNEKVTLFHFEDKLRSGVADVIASLKQAGLNILMLTGDHVFSAKRVAKAVGIDEVYFSLKPEDKLDHVKSLSQNTGLIMVGDGINDAPALAAATVGIVLAQRASATAIAVADVLLLQDNINGVPFVIAKAQQTVALVKQSVTLALSCIFLAALPSVLGFLPLWLTVLLHEGGTLLVCLNSVRALNDPANSWSWG